MYWGKICIHTSQYTVLVPKYLFIVKSKAMSCFATISNLRDLEGIFVYQDGTVRFTYSSPEYVKIINEAVVVKDDFQTCLNHDIEQFLGL